MPSDKEHIEVAVLTTSGRFPETGYNRVATHQEVKVELEKAAKNLRITNTAGWIATVGSREIDIAKSYLADALEGQITIDFGPRASGGGNRA